MLDVVSWGLEFGNCLMTPIICYYNKGSIFDQYIQSPPPTPPTPSSLSLSSSSSSSSSSLSPESIHTMTSGQIFVIGVKIQPAADYKVDKACSFYDNFNKFKSYIKFTYSLTDSSEDLVAQLATSNTDITLSGSANWWDVEGYNTITMKQADNGDGIIVSTVTKLEVSDCYINKILSLVLTLTITLDDTTTPITTSNYNSKNLTSIARDECELRHLMERNRHHPPKIPPKNIIARLKLVDPMTITCRSHEISPVSTILSIIIENTYSIRDIIIKDIIIRLRVSMINKAKFIQSICDSTGVRDELENTVDDIDDDDDDGKSYTFTTLSVNDDMLLMREDDLLHGDEYYTIEPIKKQQMQQLSLPEVIKVNESHHFTYLITCKNKKINSIGLQARELSTPCLVAWSESDSIAEMQTEYVFSWSMGMNYLSTNYKKSLIASATNTSSSCYFDYNNHYTTLSVNITGPVTALVKQPLVLHIKLTNASSKTTKRLTLSFDASSQDGSFIVLENNIRINDVHAGDSVVSCMTFMPLTTGLLYLDGFFIQEEGSQVKQYIAHVYKLQILSSNTD